MYYYIEKYVKFCLFVFTIAELRCTMLLTYLDEYAREPILLHEDKIPKSLSIYDCPEQLKISDHYPPLAGNWILRLI